MATPRLNPILDGLSGQVGNLVFSERYGKTVMSRKNTAKREFNENQKAQQLKFATAAQYSKAVLADAQARIPYDEAAKEKNTPVSGLIVADYLNKPNVEDIDLGLYGRQVGDKILVLATDDFEVMSVDVQIKNANGDEVEHGAAVKSPEALGRWVYTATVQVPANEAFSVVAVATDRPGNKGTKTVTVQ